MGSSLSGYEFVLMAEIEQLNDDFGFEVDDCYQMADLAERLGISLRDLAEYCFRAVEALEPSEEEEILSMLNMMNFLQITSEEELDAICAYYKCEYCDLNQLKVYQYRKNHSK